jgi:hypothetical protein
MKLIPSILCLFSVAIGLSASEERVEVVVWVELDPMIVVGQEYPLSIETAAERLLEEARLLLSAMIYGYRFSYTPLDRSRDVETQFDLTPLASIKWGDPRLSISYTEVRDSRFFGKVAYRLREHQTARRESWASSVNPLSSGRGEESLFIGPTAKFQAFQEAIRQAVRNHARKLSPNKPREITGEVVLWEEPSTIIVSGSYVSSVVVKLYVRDIVPYVLF